MGARVKYPTLFKIIYSYIGMTKTQAIKYLHRAEKNGFIAYHHGLVTHEVESRYSGNTTGLYWGINIVCGEENRHMFSRAKIIWDADHAERIFPGKTQKKQTNGNNIRT